MRDNENLYGIISGHYEVTTTVICNCDEKEVMKYERVHFNPAPDLEPIHTYCCDRCGGDTDLGDNQLRNKNGKYKKEYVLD